MIKKNKRRPKQDVKAHFSCISDHLHSLGASCALLHATSPSSCTYGFIRSTPRLVSLGLRGQNSSLVTERPEQHIGTSCKSTIVT